MSALTSCERLAVRNEPAARRKPRLRSGSPLGRRQPAPSGGRLLYGSFEQLGLSVEWHEFDLAAGGDQALTFSPESLVLCLNLAGQGQVGCGSTSREFAALTAGFFLPGRNSLQLRRQAGQGHRFAIISFSVAYLRPFLAGCDGALHRLVESFLREGAAAAGLGEVHRLTAEQEQTLARFVQPPVFQRARPLWYQSQVLQLLADFFFERPDADELLCDRQKRMARERSARVMAILRERLAEPPTLEALGREVGCSSFYLSRTFSQETGMTIPQYLRKIRMERAAELLQGGRHNVTEAALEVGYSSLSHFSQAFCQVMGCCPGLYPLQPKAAAPRSGGS